MSATWRAGVSDSSKSVHAAANAAERAMSHVLVVHHDADLYGADKSLLRTLRAFNANSLIPIVAVPHHGPLIDLLRAEGIEVHIGPVGKLTRQLTKPLSFARVVRDILSAMRFLSRIVAGRRVLLAYSNSGAVLGGALWGLLHGVPRLWHVREIVVAPWIAARGFPRMFKMLGGWCVCNSHATRRWIVGECPALVARSSVIWNGLEQVNTPHPAAIQAFREKLGLTPDEILVTLVGRINRWKGQGVFIDAAARIKAKRIGGVRFLIVGDVADGQHHFRDAMFGQIRAAGLEGMVSWHPFTPDVDVVWAASDIAVVPSIWPEPFGRVAIEAMAHGLPVVAAAHGGLTEIVEHEVTGLLVTPGSSERLGEALARLIDDPRLRESLGAAGRARQLAHFSQIEHDRKLLALIRVLSGLPRNVLQGASSGVTGD
jgi:glycosyltransferase involved in cell wall biosynthesis